VSELVVSRRNQSRSGKEKGELRKGRDGSILPNVNKQRKMGRSKQHYVSTSSLISIERAPCSLAYASDV
jgi:hypothetical protein